MYRIKYIWNTVSYIEYCIHITVLGCLFFRVCGPFVFVSKILIMTCNKFIYIPKQGDIREKLKCFEVSDGVYKW